MIRTTCLLALLTLLPACGSNTSTTDAGPDNLDGLTRDQGVKPETVPSRLAYIVLGQHSAITAYNGTLLASAYERGFGDLVLVTAKTGDLAEVTREIIDGVPAGLKPTKDPSGWRGGIETAGDDVGRDTDIIISAANVPMIAYRDVTNSAQKFAAKYQGKWALHQLQKAKGSKEVMGRYSSMVLLERRPAIAYLVLNVDGGNGVYKSELRWAHAIKERPAAAADWNVTTIESRPMTCQNLCDSGEVCVPNATGYASTCRKTSSGCSSCSSGQACVGGKCVTIIPKTTVEGIAKASGLWASAVVTGSGPAVIYHDNLEGTLRAAKLQGSQWTTAVLRGTPGKDSLGAFCAAAVDASGTIHVAYQDAKLTRLHYAQVDLATLKVTIDEIVDDGVRSDGPHPVGADAAIVVDGAGAVRVVYQDALTSDLLGARRAGPGNWMPRDTTRTDLGRTVKGGPRAFGFYSDLVLEGNVVYGSTLFYDQKSKWPSPKGDLVFYRVN